jgi:hypothetical protein
MTNIYIGKFLNTFPRNNIHFYGLKNILLNRRAFKMPTFIFLEISMRDGLDQTSQMISKGSKAHCKEERKDDTRRPIPIDATG